MRRGGGHEIYCAPGPFRVNSKLERIPGQPQPPPTW
jgi:hypothetical protein